jgi:transposase-like protein
MMEEHGVEVDHATLNRWVLKYVPLLEQELQARKQPVGPSWRMDETCVRVKGSRKYLYRAVDKAGATVDFLGSQSRTEVFTQGDQEERYAREDHD